MAEALWSQSSGVDYSAAEDRRLISAMYTNGVINGLGLSAGSGLSVIVAAGRAVVPDGSGGAYLCYFDTATTVPALPASSTSQVWVTVHPTTGQATLGAGTSLPTNPYITIGSVVTSAAAVSSVNNVRALAQSPAGATPTNYLPITGGALTGSAHLTATRLTTPAFDASASFLHAPRGVRFGSATNPTMRHGGRWYRDAEQAVANSVWTGIRVGNVSKSFSDYGAPTISQPAPGGVDGTRFLAAVAGDYHITGGCHFVANLTGTRRGRIRAFTAAGAQAWTKALPIYIALENRIINFDAMLSADAPGWYFVLEVYQDSGGQLNLETTTAFSTGSMPWAAFRLIQAD